MPKRTDLRKILIIGSGPIVIGQACEFDYSGTQACKALRQEGYEVVLVNSNPATIMTDPEMADRTYIEPLTVESVSAIIRRERPDALLPTVGGQTALNLAIALADSGVLEECGVEMIGAKREAIRIAEDRMLFKQDRKSTRLNSSHDQISYAVFCLKKKKKKREGATHYISRNSKKMTLTAESETKLSSFGGAAAICAPYRRV